MIIQIRNPYSWETLAAFDADVYELNSPEESSSVTINIDDDAAPAAVNTYVGSFILVDKGVYVVTSAGLTAGVLKIAFTEPTVWLRQQAFMRTRQTGATWGSITAEIIRRNEDATYSRDFPEGKQLQAGVFSVVDSCAIAYPDGAGQPGETTLVDSFDEFIDAAIASGVILSWAPTSTGYALKVSDTPPARSTRNMIMDGTTNILLDESYDQDLVSSVMLSVRRDTYGTDVFEFKFGADGRFHCSKWFGNELMNSILPTHDSWTDVPSNTYAARGIYLSSFMSYEGAQAYLQEIADSNVINYAISFSTKTVVRVGDTIRTRLHGTAYTAKVSGVKKTSGSDRYTVRCGNLSSTASDRFKYPVINGVLYL